MSDDRVYRPTDDDLPLTTESEDLPMDVPGPRPSLLTPRQEEFFRSQASLLKSDVDGSNIFQAYGELEVTGEDPREAMIRYGNERLNRSRRELKDYVQEVLATSEGPEGTVATVQTWQDVDQGMSINEGTPERQLVESGKGEKSPDELEVAKIEAELLAVNTLMNIVDNYGTLEKVWDFAKMLLPTAIVDNIQVSGMPFGAEEYMRQAVVGLKDMRRNDPEKFKKVFPVIVAELEEVLPKSKQIQVLSAVVGARGEEELDYFSNLDAALDLVDIAGLGAGLAVTSARLMSRLNTVKTLSRLENRALAADVAAVSVLDDTGEVARKAGTTPETAYNNASPLNVGALDEAYTGGLSADVLERIEKVRRSQQLTAEDVLTKTTFLQEGAFDDAYRLAKEEQAYQTLRAKDGVADINVIYRDQAETVFAYKYKGPDGELVTDTFNMALELDDLTGFWKNTERMQVANYISSPSVFAHFDRKGVEAAIRLDSTSAVVGKKFVEMQREALAPILGKGGWKALSPTARKELAQVDEVLLAGDAFKDHLGNQGKVYSVAELKGGVVNGVRLNDRQIEVYFNVRSLYDNLHHIRDVATRRSLVANGYKEVRLSDGTPHVGKPYTYQGAVGMVNTSGEVKVWDSATESVRRISNKELDQIYNKEGRTIAQLKENITPADGAFGEFNLVLTHGNQVGDLPASVLRYRVGYVPKTDRASRWFVKTLEDKSINGTVVSGQVGATVRKFVTRAEAERWLKTQPNAEKLTLLPDRAMEQQVLGSSGNGSGGGLYTSRRAAEDIPFGFDGRPAERMNTYEALVHNLGQLERYLTRDQWRQGQQRKWINSAKAAGFKHIDSFEPALLPDGDPRSVGLKRYAEQIDLWSGFPSKSELRWDGLVTSTMELLTRQWPQHTNRFANIGQRVRETDPVSFIRSLTFRVLLGMFNPVQIWIQAQGAANAVSLAPRYAARAIPIQMSLSAARLAPKMDNPTRKVLAKTAGLSVDEFNALERAWKRTGYTDSLSNTADYTAATRGVGLLGDQIGRAVDSTSVLYRTGESINRRISFAVAALRRKEKTGTFNFTDSDLKVVMADANNLMMNMSKANAASWQRGIIAIPTQFWQVFSKFAETLTGINGYLSRKERIKLAAGHFMLYGAAGLPFGAGVIRTLSEYYGMSQEDIDALPPELVEGLNQGMWGLAFNSLLGADIDVANRGAIAEGMMDQLLDIIHSDSSIGEILVGASGSLPQRLQRVYKQIRPMMLNGSNEPLTQEEALHAVSTLATVASSWNNFQKGMFMLRVGRITDSRGNPIIDGKDITMTAYMQMFGFQPKDITTTFDLERLVRGKEEYIREVSNSIITHYWNYVTILDGVEDESRRDRIMKNYEAGTRMLMATLNEGEQERVREIVNRRLSDPETRYERAVRQYIEAFADNHVTEFVDILNTTRASGLIQLNTNE